MSQIVKMKDVRFGAELFENYHSMTALDDLLCSYKGLPKGVNYMIIGDPGVGKTTVILDLIANISRQAQRARVLFISAEMNEIDLAIYVKRYPKFGNLDIMFVEADFEGEKKHLQEIEEVLEKGWDIVAIDSFHELQGIIKEEEDISMRLAETRLLSLIKKHNKGENATNTRVTRVGTGTSDFHFTDAVDDMALIVDIADDTTSWEMRDGHVAVDYQVLESRSVGGGEYAASYTS